MIDIFPAHIGTSFSQFWILFRARHMWRENPQVEKNVENFQRDQWVKKAFFLAQHHSSNVVCVTEKNQEDIISADACISQLRDISLNVVVADCVPILLYDIKNHIIGAIHAGWKGASEKILTKTLQKMQSDFGSFSEDICVYFWPSICQDCYEVGQEVASIFSSDFIQPSSNSWKFLLDVKKSCMREAQVFWILKSHIEVSLECTFELPEKYFSYRRTGKKENFAVGIFQRNFDLSS